MSFKLGILVSGRGSNLQAIIDAIDQKKIVAEIAIVISNKPHAFALERAKKANVQTEIIEPIKGETREDYDDRVLKVLKRYNVDLVVLAGFMRILSSRLVQAYPNKMINIHPSLLPAFPGLQAQKQALEAKASESGVTVHFVDGGCDTGPIIAQTRVPILPTDTEETLSARILVEEHRLLPKIIDLIAKNKVKISNQTVSLLED